MDEEHYYIALDFGSSKTAAMIARKDEVGKINILDVEHVGRGEGVQRGSIQNPTLAAKEAKAALDKIGNCSFLTGKKIAYVIAGLTGYSFQTRPAHAATSSNRDVELTRERMNELENTAINHLDLDDREKVYEMIEQEFMIDGALAPALEGNKYQEIEARYQAVIGKVDMDKRIKQAFQNITLSNKSFFAPAQTAMAASTPDEQELGCVVVDFGAHTTSVVVIKDNIIRHAAVIPVGGNIVTRDLTSLLLGENVAEKLKKQYGCALVDKVTELGVTQVLHDNGQKKIDLRDSAKIIEAREDEIMDMVCGEIDKSGYWSELKAGIIITGGASKMKFLDNLIEIKTGMNVRHADWKHLISSSTKELFVAPENALMIGLINSAILSDSDNCVIQKTQETTDSTLEATAKTDKTPVTTKKEKDIFSRLSERLQKSLFDNDTV